MTKLNLNGTTDRVMELMKKNDELYEKAADLNIDISKLNDLKSATICLRNIWHYIKDVNTSYMDDIAIQMNSFNEYNKKIKGEFPLVDNDKVIKVTTTLIGQ